MLSITTKSPYALSALAELARIGAEVPVPIGELARRREIPVQLLEQPFAVLRRAGLPPSPPGGLGGECPVPIGELARRREIPVQFLEQLFAVLRRAGLLPSQRGVKGGYSFARPPAEITVLELVELLDGQLGAGAEGVFAE